MASNEVAKSTSICKIVGEVWSDLFKIDTREMSYQGMERGELHVRAELESAVKGKRSE